MKQVLNSFDVKLIIVIIFFMLLKGIFNIYYLFTYGTNIEEKDLFINYEKNSIFYLTNLITGFVFLFSSIYFFMNNKIKTVLFGLFCLYMIARVFGIFLTLTNADLPILNVAQESKFIYYNMTIASILTIFFTLYLLRLIFV